MQAIHAIIDSVLDELEDHQHGTTLVEPVTIRHVGKRADLEDAMRIISIVFLPAPRTKLALALVDPTDEERRHGDAALAFSFSKV